MAALYKNKSVAEQNSLDIAWAVLMSEEFRSFVRPYLLLELISFRFRQVIVNIVLRHLDKEQNDLARTVGTGLWW
jgi:hypothetical protein